MSAHAWSNWSGSATSCPSEILQPASEQEVVAIVERASRAGQRVKAVGAGHSFTALAATDGMLVNLDRIAGLVAVDRELMTARIRAGTRLRDIPGLLQPHGLALANQGDVDPQSLAGAISTGTHGTGLGHTGFAGMVRSFRIVTPDGMARHAHPEAAGLEGRLFELARVSLGAFGIVTEVEIDVVDTFILEASEHAEPLDGVIADFENLARGADHFEYYWFPRTDIACTKYNTRLPASETPHPVPTWRKVVADEAMNNGLFGAMCQVASVIPPLSRPLAQLSARFLAQRDYSDYAHNVFVSTRRVRFNEMEYAVDLADATAVLSEVRATFNRSDQQVIFPIEVRATAADSVPLSTAKGRESCYIAVHRFHRDDHEALFAQIEPIFKAAGGRPHWGKLHTLGFEELSARHEDLADAAQLRAEVDPAGMFVNDAVRRVFGMA